MKGKAEKTANKKMKEKVDILLATYKSNINYLKKQIDSILSQTYKNISLIISDDNSQDEELEKTLKEYAEKDNRVQIYFQKENTGYIKNFGFLLEKSTAEYIMYSDHDDIWYPEKVEKSLKELVENDVDLVYVNSKQIDQNDKVIKESYFKYKNMPLIYGKSKLAISRCIGIGCSQIFTRNVAEKMIPFKDSVMAHDWLAAFIANEQKGLAYIEEPLFDYRLHTDNVFGGRNLNQNISRWKEKNGKTFKSYLEYRKKDVIEKAYLSGAQMCLEYSKKQSTKKFLNELIKYYSKLEKTKYINWNLIKYFKFLAGHNLAKKMLKEIIIFHFPILGYLIFKIE